MSARRGEEGLCPPHRILNIDIVAKDLGRLDPLTHRVTPRRLSGSSLGQRVDRAAGDAKRWRRSLGHEHVRERVKRPRALDQLRVLKAEAAFLGDKNVAHDEVAAAGAAQPGRVPRVQDLALLQLQEALSGFRNAIAIDARGAVLDDGAAEPGPFGMMATADERE